MRPTETETGRPTYLVKLKPEFADLPDYKGRIEIRREYRAIFSRDQADFMTIVGTGITHAQKRHFEIRPFVRHEPEPRRRAKRRKA